MADQQMNGHVAPIDLFYNLFALEFVRVEGEIAVINA